MRGRSDVLEPAILGLLHEAPMHGYELRKRLNLVLGSFRALSYGSLYPCLKSLVDRGWIVGTESVVALDQRLQARVERAVRERTERAEHEVEALAQLVAVHGRFVQQPEDGRLEHVGTTAHGHLLGMLSTHRVEVRCINSIHLESMSS